MRLLLPTPVGRLINFVHERELIRVRKAHDARRPWTEDQILNTWRFCNVHRNDDRETQWIHEHIIRQHTGHELVWFNLAIARFINWSPALNVLGFFTRWIPEAFIEKMEDLMLVGKKVYTGAYMIPAGPKGMVKHEWLANSVFTRLYDRHFRCGSSLKSCQEWDELVFAPIPGMGPFMRNQIITDMKYSHHLPKNKTCDWTVFCLAGPGTIRGLNRIHKVPLEKSMDQVKANASLQVVRATLQEEFKDQDFDDLNDTANCLCEFDKYERVRLGQGKPRSRYTAYEEKS